MCVLPPVDVSRFVGRDLLEEVVRAPALYRCDQIGAVVTMCHWRPTVFTERTPRRTVEASADTVFQ